MANHRFNVGDVVFVADREILEKEEYTEDNNPGFCYEMYDLAGAEVTITKVTGVDEYYQISNDPHHYWWSPAWLMRPEPCVKFDVDALNNLLQ